jgi:hypothetical protein
MICEGLPCGSPVSFFLLVLIVVAVLFSWHILNIFSAPLRRFDCGGLLEPQLLDGIFAHFIFEDFAGGVHREFGDELDVARDLVLGHIGVDKILDLLLGHGFTVLQDDTGHDLLAVGHGRDADDLDITDFGVRIQEFLDFLRIDIL